MVEHDVESIQDVLTRACAEILNSDKVDADDDFFVLGGHSLAAGRLITHIRDEFQVDVHLSDFFAEPTMRSLAVLVQNGSPYVPDDDDE